MRSPWRSSSFRKQVFVWTRRAGIFAMVVGCWELAGSIDLWSMGDPPDPGQVTRWLASVIIGFVIWYRLRDIEDEIQEEATPPTPSRHG